MLRKVLCLILFLAITLAGCRPPVNNRITPTDTGQDGADFICLPGTANCDQNGLLTYGLAGSNEDEEEDSASNGEEEAESVEESQPVEVESGSSDSEVVDVSSESDGGYSGDADDSGDGGSGGGDE